MGLPALPVRWKPGLLWTTSILLTALLLRLAAAAGELWLDEIWSLRQVETLQSPLEVVTQLKHDNNHFLNSLYLYSLGQGWPWFVYRLPSIAAGIATVWIAGQVAKHWGRVEQITAMLLFSTAYLMIHYSSEARGYSMMLLCCIAAYALLVKSLRLGHSLRRAGDVSPLMTPEESGASQPPLAKPYRWAAYFAIVASLGFAAQPLFLHFYLAALAWSIAQIAQQDISNRRKVTWLAACHALPILFLAAIYWINLREVRLGGGPSTNVLATLCEAASLTLGGPASGPGAFVVSGCLLAAIVGSCYVLRAHGDAEWKLLVGAIVVPWLPLLVTQPPFLYPRYFLISVMFSLLATAGGLGWLWRQRTWGRPVYGTILTAFLIGNGLHIGGLLQHGRGQLLETLRYIAESDPHPVITLTSDHNHGVGMLVSFYARYLPPGRELKYVECQHWPAEPPTWLVFHVLEHSESTLGSEVEIPDDGSRYRLERSYPAPLLSGWGLRCYRLMEDGNRERDKLGRS